MYGDTAPAWFTEGFGQLAEGTLRQLTGMGGSLTILQGLAGIQTNLIRLQIILNKVSWGRLEPIDPSEEPLQAENRKYGDGSVTPYSVVPASDGRLPANEYVRVITATRWFVLKSLIPAEPTSLEDTR